MMRSRPYRLGLLLVFLLLAGCGTAGLAAPPRYTNYVIIPPASRAQVRTVQFAPDRNECWAIAQVHSELKNLRCYDTLTLQLGTLQQTGRWKVGYASMRQCVARLTTEELKAGCVNTIDHCALHGGTDCGPAWTAQTSIEFRTDGHQVQKEWLTCGMGSFQRFRYHLHWCGTSAFGPLRKGWLSLGDDYELDIPHVVQVGAEERVALEPNGSLLFENCC